MDEAYKFKQTLMVTRTEKFALFFPDAINLWRLTLGERLNVRDFIAQSAECIWNLAHRFYFNCLVSCVKDCPAQKLLHPIHHHIRV